mgnify:CR=1 FL=1
MSGNKQGLLQRIDGLQAQTYLEKMELAQLDELRQLVQDERFSVVVIGEFSRGKSTFINALLGAALIPMDVLPETAVIHALHYGEEPALTVVRRDGSTEKGKASSEYLQQFVVGNQDVDAVSYIKIAYPADFLAGNVLLVDTPGVSDMDEQRAEITYGFLPQADVVIVLLDATAPLKKTEKDFINQRVLPQGIRRVIFVANKADHIDPEEVPDNYAEILQKRLDKAFGESLEGELFLVSAKLALDSALQKNASLWEQSGMEVLTARLREIFAAERAGIRDSRLQWQYRRICGRIYRRLTSEKCLMGMKGSALEAARDSLGQLIASRGEAPHIEEYAAQTEQHILQMTEKSLKFFYDKLHEEVVELVMEYGGQDFKMFVERRLQRNVQREIDNWIAMYSPRIEQLISKMKIELAQGLSRYFNQQVNAGKVSGQMGLAGSYGIRLESMDISNTDVKAGALAALGGIGLTLMAGSALMPFVSFAAMPLIRRQMLEHDLEKARAVLIPDLEEQLIGCFVQLLADVQARIHELVGCAMAEVMECYRMLLEEQRMRLDDEIERKKHDEMAVQQKQTELEEQLQNLQTWML